MAADRLVILMNSNAKMSRGKYAAQAVHAALMAFGVHPGCPVVVLGAKLDEVQRLPVTVADAGRTELAPGTVTAGTDWPSMLPEREAAAKVLAAAEELADAHRAVQRVIVIPGADRNDVDLARAFAIRHVADAVDEWRASR